VEDSSPSDESDINQPETPSNNPFIG